jgi:hypothetical protein
MAASPASRTTIDWWNGPNRPARPADREPPRVVAVDGQSGPDTVYVRFSKLIARATTVDPANYSLDGGATWCDAPAAV